jgi:hypothetical protein
LNVIFTCPNLLLPIASPELLRKARKESAAFSVGNGTPLEKLLGGFRPSLLPKAAGLQ